VKDLAPALRVPGFRRWWLALLAMGIGMQMLEVAVGCEVYGLHRSPLDLGWIGLAEFLPLFVLALPAGHLADRLPRRLLFGAALVLGAGVGAGLAAVTAAGATSLVPHLGLAAGVGRRDGARYAGCSPPWPGSTGSRTSRRPRSPHEPRPPRLAVA
jgi:MFS family permease